MCAGVSAPGLVGVDVVEVAPSLDATPATALLGGRIALEAMAFHARGGRASHVARSARPARPPDPGGRGQRRRAVDLIGAARATPT